MAYRVQDIESLRETARRAGTLANVREYYRQVAAERQVLNLCAPEKEMAAALRRRPETQNAPLASD
ncbi:MAG: hypothetical protein ACO1SX_13040 [Actinomycetota bacterium]